MVFILDVTVVVVAADDTNDVDVVDDNTWSIAFAVST